MRGEAETNSGPKFPDKQTWLFLICFFCLYFIFFLIFSPFQFLDGDDAMEAIWALAKQKGIDPYQFPLHGYQSRSGTFALIYLCSFVLRSPQLAFGILSAVSASLALAILPLYSCLILGIKPKAIHWLLIFCSAVEIVYAGLYPNAAIIGYGLGFLSIFLSLWLSVNNKKYYSYFFSGALYGLALAASMSAGYLCLTFPLQHFLFRKDRNLNQILGNFGLEIFSGMIVYLGFQSLMGLSPLAAFQEFQDVYQRFSGFLPTYTIITFLGAFTISVMLITFIGTILLIYYRRGPAFFIGSANFLLFSLILGLAFTAVKSFQHALSMYIIVCFSVIYIWELLKKPYQKYLYFIIIILPLLFGLRLYLPEQPYRGPGFSEIDLGKPLTLEEKDHQGLGGFRIWQSPKVMVKGRGIRLALGSGFMLPTVDGGRAFGGYLWSWMIDWKPYLDSINQPYQTIMQSGENDLVMGQFAVAAITMYNLVRDGYRPSYIYWRDFYFKKGDRIVRNYWYFNVLSEYVGKDEMSLDLAPKSITQALLIVSPSFAYRLETKELSIKDFSYQSYGYFGFKIKRE